MKVIICLVFLLFNVQKANSDESVRKFKVNISEAGTLDRSDTEYILDTDIVAEGTAFTILGENLTFNLNGHKIIYNNRRSANGPRSVYGIVIPTFKKKNISIINGIIEQGEGQGRGDVIGWGHNPIFAEEIDNLEIAGITAIYGGKDIVGFFLHWCRQTNIHHNILEDRGNFISNRHQGIDAIRVGGPGARILHNLIKRSRHRAITVASNSEVAHNEIHIDSQATNAYGIMGYKINNFSFHDNQIFGVGEHPIGIGVIADSTQGKVYNNFIEVQSTKRSLEYETPGSAGIRLTWGGDNIELFDNIIIIHAQNNFLPGFNSWGRALWVGLPKPEQKADIRDNLIIALSDDGLAKAAGIAVVCNNESPHLIFKNNTILSNWGNVLLSDNYGHAGGYARFIENTFIRLGNNPGFKTIRSQYLFVPSTGVFIGNKFENGASLENIDLEYQAKALKEIIIGSYLSVEISDKQGEPVAAARILIRDNSGKLVFEGESDEKGVLKAEIHEYLLTNGSIKNKILKTPHTILVTKEKREIKKTITTEGSNRLRIVL